MQELAHAVATPNEVGSTSTSTPNVDITNPHYFMFGCIYKQRAQFQAH
jgi:hypothetical protein